MRFSFLKTITLTLLLTGSNLIFAQTDSPTEKFDHLMTVVERMYVDSVDSEHLVEKAIVAMLKELDPHSVYISKEEVQKMNEPLVGKFEGIGIQFNIIKDTITVVSAISGGPSEKLGIRANDKIVTIEEENVAGSGIKNIDVIKKLRGDKGTKVNVGIKRRSEKEILSYEITRDKIPIFSMDASYMATPEIGYIKLNKFGATTMREYRKGLDTLKAQGMQSLILDLRGNGGGYLKTAIDLADEFLPSRDLIVYTEGRSYPKDEKYATSFGNFEDGKLVVLVDQGSASASEIVAGAIQDHDRGLIIGRRSFGKGLVQKPYPLPDGSVVRMTISRYYTPTGRSIQKPYEDYKTDFTDRLERGEFFSQDSIKLPDSLKFYTDNKRTVYGGGGIIPDIFIPIDTSMNSDYLRDLNRKGISGEFALDYIDNHRKEIRKQYPTLKQFKANFKITDELLEELISYAEKEGVERNNEEFQTSRPMIEAQLKGLIARGFWKTNGYFSIINEVDMGYKKAIESIQDDTFHKMKLANNRP